MRLPTGTGGVKLIEERAEVLLFVEQRGPIDEGFEGSVGAERG